MLSKRRSSAVWSEALARPNETFCALSTAGAHKLPARPSRTIGLRIFMMVMDYGMVAGEL